MELDQSVAAERAGMKANVTAIAILAAGYAIAHEIDHELLYTNIWSNLLAAPSLIMGAMPVGGLMKNFTRLRRFRKQRERLQFPSPVEDGSIQE